MFTEFSILSLAFWKCLNVSGEAGEWWANEDTMKHTGNETSNRCAGLSCPSGVLTCWA
jgi:hypothetical protein